MTDEGEREHTTLARGPANEVGTVREIFRLAVEETRGAKSICQILNRRGVPGSRSPHWNQSSVGAVLNNRTYVGDSVWNKRNTKTGNKKDEEDWFINENTHEPIIDLELFVRRKKLAAQRSFNLRSSPRRAVKYLLARMIRCDYCGGLDVGRRQKKRGKKNGEYYDLFRDRCNSYVTKGRSVCPSLGLHCEWIKGEIVELVRREICSPDRLAALQGLVQTKIEARRNRYGQNPRELDRRIKNYYRTIGDGLDAKTCREHIGRLEAEKEEVQEEAELLRQDDYYRHALQRNLEELERFAVVFKDDFRTLPMATQRRVLLHFIDEFRVVDHEVIRVALKVPFDDSGVRHLTDEILISEGSAAVAARKGQDLLSPMRGMLDRAAARSESRLLGPAGGSHSLSMG